MMKIKDDKIGLLRMNGGIQRGMEIRTKYDFSAIFALQKKNYKKNLYENVIARIKKIRYIQYLF